LPTVVDLPKSGERRDAKEDEGQPNRKRVLKLDDLFMLSTFSGRLCLLYTPMQLPLPSCLPTPTSSRWYIGDTTVSSLSKSEDFKYY
ncbi:hypothetical protein IAQ61_000392, partial [Plenodomus lingam]|uniref:uncharacterized protein n=1 Tax=Leptosphaeria maculans TaxID=5022 RepID=UPI0033272367